MKITSKDLKTIIKEELEAVLGEQDKKADFPNYDAAEAAIEKGQLNVGQTFTFYNSYQDVVKKAIFAGKREIAVSDMPEDVSVVFYIRRGDVTSMRKKDMGAAAELDKKYRDPRGPVARGLEPYTLFENVPQEAKEKLFDKMKKKNQVPDDGDINDAEFWEVKEGDYGYSHSVVVDGKHYYGEI